MSKNWLFLVVVLTLLSSCRTVFTMDTIMQINKGDLSRDVQKMLDLSPTQSYTVSYLGNEYTVKTYSILVGVKTSQENVQTTGTIITPTSTINTTTNNTVQRKTGLAIDYFFLFGSDDKLVFWGFLQEFSKNEDTFISGIAPVIQEKYYLLSDY